MSIGHQIYFEKELRGDFKGHSIDYLIEREYKTTLVEGVPLRMCVATEIMKFDEQHRLKEIIRFNRDGKIKERVVYSWEDCVNIVDVYKDTEHTCRDIIEYDQRGRHIKKEWYDVENGDLIYRGIETSEYDDKGREICNSWVNASRNYNCWKWVTEYFDNERKVKKSHYKGPQLNDFSHSLFYLYDENGNEIEKRIVHRKGALHSRDSIEYNRYDEEKILSHIATYIFPDGREYTYEDDVYMYDDVNLSKVQHINNRETQYFYNKLGQLYLELDLKDGKVVSVKNYSYDDMNNEIRKESNFISDNKHIIHEYKYDKNGNKVYEKRLEESSAEIKIVEKEWEISYRHSSILVKKDY